MTLRQYLSRLKADHKTTWIAISWVCFMIFFTYTDLLVASVSNNLSLTNEFQKLHIRSVSLFVNFGLIIMLLFDYSAKNKNISNPLLWTIIIGLFLCLSIYFHCCKVMNNTHTDLYFPLNWENLSLLLFVILMIFLFIIKTFVEFSQPTVVSDEILIKP